MAGTVLIDCRAVLLSARACAGPDALVLLRGVGRLWAAAWAWSNGGHAVAIEASDTMGDRLAVPVATEA